MAALSRDVLRIDTDKEIERCSAELRKQLSKQLRRQGIVVGLSGGIDSSTVAALAVRALGKDRVLGLHMHERESSDETRKLSKLIADHLQIKSVDEDISGPLDALGCYRRRDDAIRGVVPDYGPGWKNKIVLPNVLAMDTLPLFSIIVETPDGKQSKARLDNAAYLGIVAATNFKQRVRKTLEYYHADRLNYAVAGTPNRLEYDLGFFVKNGDGSADVKPIAHLYKSQVYQLAAVLGVPEEIRKRPPTTDTYSLTQGQDEFYFALPYDQMDLCLYAYNHRVPAADVGATLGLTAEQVERVYRDIESKRRFAEYLHMAPLGLPLD